MAVYILSISNVMFLSHFQGQNRAVTGKYYFLFDQTVSRKEVFIVPRDNPSRWYFSPLEDRVSLSVLNSLVSWEEFRMA